MSARIEEWERDGGIVTLEVDRYERVQCSAQLLHRLLNPGS